MPATATVPTRRLTIDRCEQITQGAGKDGRTWTLYRVQARDEDGQRIAHELVTFDELEPGAIDLFRIERRDHERYGTSFLLKRARGKLADRVDQLEHRAEDYERRIAVLEATPPY